MHQGALLGMSNLPAGWCCYVLLCSDGFYDSGVSSNLARHIRKNGLSNHSGAAAPEQPVALVWYESTRDSKGAASRQQKLKAWSEGQRVTKAGKCVPFEGSGKNVWIPLVWFRTTK